MTNDLVRMKLANILKNFHRNTPHPEAECDDVDVAIDAILRVFDDRCGPLIPGVPVTIGVDTAKCESTTSYWIGLPADEHQRMQEAIQQEFSSLRRRIQELLEANNRYLERARIAERNSLERKARDERQTAMLRWARETFADVDGCDVNAIDERARRHVEEAIELGQACGLNADDVTRIVSRAYSRQPGVPMMEIGQSAMTLSILAEVLGGSVCWAEVEEFSRVQQIDRSEFARRHKAKMAVGI